MTNVKFGDIIVSNDGTVIQVHDIDELGAVHYTSFVNGTQGKIQNEPFCRFYGYIYDCHPASENDKKFLEDWINEHE